MLFIVLPSLISYYFFPVWVWIFISFITICVVFFYITRTTKALYHVLLLIIGQMISYSLTKIFMLPIVLNAFAWLEHVFMILLNVIFVYIFFKRLNKGIEFTNFTMNMQLFIFFILCSSSIVFLINIFQHINDRQFLDICLFFYTIFVSRYSIDSAVFVATSIPQKSAFKDGNGETESVVKLYCCS